MIDDFEFYGPLYRLYRVWSVNLLTLFMESPKGSKVIVWPSLYDRYVARLQGFELDTLDGS